MSWPLYKGYGHAFDAFKNMVQDDGAAIFKKLEEDKGPLTVLTPQVGGCWCVSECCSLYIGSSGQLQLMEPRRGPWCVWGLACTGSQTRCLCV